MGEGKGVMGKVFGDYNAYKQTNFVGESYEQSLKDARNGWNKSERYTHLLNDEPLKELFESYLPRVNDGFFENYNGIIDGSYDAAEKAMGTAYDFMENYFTNSLLYGHEKAIESYA